jgi:hypothetical protein
MIMIVLEEYVNDGTFSHTGTDEQKVPSPHRQQDEHATGESPRGCFRVAVVDLAIVMRGTGFLTLALIFFSFAVF